MSTEFLSWALNMAAMGVLMFALGIISQRLLTRRERRKAQEEISSDDSLKEIFQMAEEELDTEEFKFFSGICGNILLTLRRSPW